MHWTHLGPGKQSGLNALNTGLLLGIMRTRPKQACEACISHSMQEQHGRNRDRDSGRHLQKNNGMDTCLMGADLFVIQ